jgi:hypothetical protein
MTRTIRITLTFCSMVGVAAFSASAATRRVPSEYASIQGAVSACEEGDTVLVAPGVYAGRANCSGVSKSVTLRSEEGPSTCIVDCQGTTGAERLTGFAFSYYKGERLNTVLDGFTIINAAGGAVAYGSMVDLHIRNCVIMSNEAPAIRFNRMFFPDGDPCVIAENCIITGNRCSGGNDSYGGAVAWEGGSAIFRNCTICGNMAGYGGAIACTGGLVRFENCIIADNRAVMLKGDQAYIGLAGSTCSETGCGTREIVFSYSRIEDDSNSIYYDTRSLPANAEVYHLENCTPADPGFTRPGYWAPNHTPTDIDDDFWVEGDYHLKSQAGRWESVSESWVRDIVTSPCIDAGDPNSPIGGEPFPNGGRINLGAYGGTAEASKSYFGKPTAETVIVGDINGDGRVDFHDLALLAGHWLQGRTPRPARN